MDTRDMVTTILKKQNVEYQALDFPKGKKVLIPRSEYGKSFTIQINCFYPDPSGVELIEFRVTDVLYVDGLNSRERSRLLFCMNKYNAIAEVSTAYISSQGILQIGYSLLSYHKNDDKINFATEVVMLIGSIIRDLRLLLDLWIDSKDAILD